MEHEIGEVFELNGKWYQCLKPSKREGKCDECIGVMKSFDFCKSFDGCAGRIFKELKKVGEPFTCNIDGNGRKVMMQEYSLYDTDFINTSPFLMHISDYNHKRIAIEVKQNKEQMEEKKLNLKDFDLEEAKAGKPVCTRDGRKARIICFDVEGDLCPIIALVKDNGIEVAYHFDKEGKNAYKKSELDLMMLPEKKEGWAIIKKDEYGYRYIDNNIFRSEEDAKRFCELEPNNIATIKIEWEE